jgi:hypothetical protein
VQADKYHKPGSKIDTGDDIEFEQVLVSVEEFLQTVIQDLAPVFAPAMQRKQKRATAAAGGGMTPMRMGVGGTPQRTGYGGGVQQSVMSSIRPPAAHTPSRMPPQTPHMLRTAPGPQSVQRRVVQSPAVATPTPLRSNPPIQSPTAMAQHIPYSHPRSPQEIVKPYTPVSAPQSVIRNDRPMPPPTVPNFMAPPKPHIQPRPPPPIRQSTPPLVSRPQPRPSPAPRPVSPFLAQTRPPAINNDPPRFEYLPSQGPSAERLPAPSRPANRPPANFPSINFEPPPQPSPEERTTNYPEPGHIRLTKPKRKRSKLLCGQATAQESVQIPASPPPSSPPSLSNRTLTKFNLSNDTPKKRPRFISPRYPPNEDPFESVKTAMDCNKVIKKPPTVQVFHDYIDDDDDDDRIAANAPQTLKEKQNLRKGYERRGAWSVEAFDLFEWKPPNFRT